MNSNKSEDNHQTDKVIYGTRTIRLPKPIPRFSTNPIIRQPDSHLSILSLQPKKETCRDTPLNFSQLVRLPRKLNRDNPKNINEGLIVESVYNTKSKTESPEPSNQQNTISKTGHMSTRSDNLKISSFGNYFSQDTSKEKGRLCVQRCLNMTNVYDFSFNKVVNGKFNCPNESLLLRKRSEPGEYGLAEFSILRFSRNRNQHVLRHFKCVYHCLMALFTENKPQLDFSEFDPICFALFVSVVERKFKVIFDPSNAEESLKQLRSVISSSVSSKRPEECKKIIFSLTIKFLKNKLRNSCKRQYRKKAFENYFYNYYFSEIAKKEHIPIQDFYYPVSYNKNKKNAYKTINKPYIGNIRKSKKFIRDFNSYINNQLIEDYKKEVSNRLMETLSKWDQEHAKYSNTTRLTDKFKVYFKNEKSKLPWTISDIQFAIKTVKAALKA